jgi:Fe-S cluster assembly iron-binding protein IscA
MKLLIIFMFVLFVGCEESTQNAIEEAVDSSNKEKTVDASSFIGVYKSGCYNPQSSVSNVSTQETEINIKSDNIEVVVKDYGHSNICGNQHVYTTRYIVDYELEDLYHPTTGEYEYTKVSYEVVSSFYTRIFDTNETEYQHFQINHGCGADSPGIEYELYQDCKFNMNGNTGELLLKNTDTDLKLVNNNIGIYFNLDNANLTLTKAQ